jgi:hypothetical protein
MATVGNEIKQKLSNKFYCEICDYTTERKSNFDNHILSAKHKMATNGHICQQVLSNNNFQCEKCKKVYKDRTGLWKHKKKCINEEININTYNKEDEVTDKDLIIMLMKKNEELQSMMMEVIKNGIGNTNNSHNTTTHTNSHNKAFNLNFFLNETCKDAMNIGEFVDSLKLQLSDLEKVGEAGYIEGITSIIVKNLKALDVTKRPVHCTDKKRETVYIKDADKWEKDEDKTHMHKLIKRVASKNIKMFEKFREAHPDCKQYHSKYSDQYNKIIYESMGGKGDDDFEKHEKIIKNVLKEVIIDKTI